MLKLKDLGPVFYASLTLFFEGYFEIGRKLDRKAQISKTKQNKKMIKKEPQPLSITERGGKIMAKIKNMEYDKNEDENKKQFLTRRLLL